MGLQISASFIAAAEVRQRATANNVANATTPGYEAQRVALAEQPGGGVAAGPVTQDPAPGVSEGSNVDLAREFTNQTVDVRALQANANAFRARAALLDEVTRLI